MKYDLNSEALERAPTKYFREIYLLNTTNTMTDCLVVGSRGAGKSIFSLKSPILISGIDTEMYEPFSVKKLVFFDIENLVKYTLPRYDEDDLLFANIVFDDAGLNAGNREYMKRLNIILGKLLECYREVQVNLWVNVPKASLIDITVRKLVGYFAIVEKKLNINNHQVCEKKIVKIYRTNTKSKSFLDDFVFDFNKSYPYKIDKFEVAPLDKKIYEEYRKMKRRAHKELLKDELEGESKERILLRKAINAMREFMTVSQIAKVLEIPRTSVYTYC